MFTVSDDCLYLQFISFTYLGDGNCRGDYNTEACGWDGGGE